MIGSFAAQSVNLGSVSYCSRSKDNDIHSFPDGDSEEKKPASSLFVFLGKALDRTTLSMWRIKQYTRRGSLYSLAKCMQSEHKLMFHEQKKN